MSGNGTTYSLHAERRRSLLGGRIEFGVLGETLDGSLGRWTAPTTQNAQTLTDGSDLGHSTHFWIVPRFMFREAKAPRDDSLEPSVLGSLTETTQPKRAWNE